MRLADRPVPSPEVLQRSDFGDPVLLFHQLLGEVAALPPVAFAIWREVDGKRSVAEIAALVKKQCEEAPPDIARDVAAFLDDLQRHGFVVMESAPSHRAGERCRQTTRPRAAPPVVHGAARPSAPLDLSVAGGIRFHLVALDEPAWRVLAQLAAAACLTTPGDAAGQTLFLATRDQADPAFAKGEPLLLLDPPGTRPFGSVGDGDPDRQAMDTPASESEWLWRQLARLSAFIGQQLQARGGILLHAALALLPSRSGSLSTRGGSGVLLGGRSGVGKSTASQRLPPPWRSLSDDTTLVVRRTDGQYWAHPWPTWSRILEHHLDDHWDVQAGVPLQAAFILEQGAADDVSPAAPAEAVALLMELSLQASRRLWEVDRHHLDIDGIRLFNRRRLDNVFALVETVPTYLLDVALDGEFWRKIEGIHALFPESRPSGHEAPAARL
ncbi:MAG: SynChlorMet cassette protein ScmC [Thermoanaerobaculaceae bacterium]|jgi:SynChlorMet cassette protein ScmC|nr:SynChlorMet cassette protein ScmC [Thermoanaerobaculaceae bacterium]